MIGGVAGGIADDGSAPPIDSIRYLASLVSELRQEVRAVAAVAAAAQSQVSAHVAVCDERQRMMSVRQADRDRWHEEQAGVSRAFMAESSSDRAKLREEIITLAQLGRTELRDWAIKLLFCILGANLISAAPAIATALKAWGTH